jgi:opacity protein-like surface antigen
MKKILLAVICLFLLGPFVQAQDVTPEMKADFLSKVKAAAAQKNFKAFSVLYSQDGTVDPAMKDQLSKFSQDIFNILSAIPSPDYKFAGPTPGQPASFTHNGKTYEPNLKIVATLQFHDPNGAPNTAASGTWGFPLGIENGALMITQTVLKP